MTGKLTPKQAAFVSEYLVDLNASAAARRAGYSAKTAHRIGQENMQKPAIAQAIAEAQQARAKKAEITAAEVVENLHLIATGETSFEERNGLGILVKHRPRFTDRLKAWELLGKHLGMFTDKVDVTSGGEPLRVLVEYTDAETEASS